MPQTDHDFYCEFHHPTTVRSMRSPSTRAQTSEYARNRHIVMQRDAGKPCGICGKPIATGDAEVDHILPVARGGSNALDNLQLAHRSCNRSKRAGVGPATGAPATSSPPTEDTTPPRSLRLR